MTRRNLFRVNGAWSLMLAALWAVLGTLACTEESGIGTQISDEEVNVSVAEYVADAAYEEVEEISLGVMEESELVRSNDRFWTPPIHLWKCATVTKDRAAKTIVVDYGAGCTGPDGKLRSGRIVIGYTNMLLVPGASRTITLENYVVDSVKLEGVKTITNVSATVNDFVSLNYKLTNGKATWPDGSVATRSVDRTRTWIRGASPLLDQTKVEGSAQGITREGVAYTVTITNPLLRKRACHAEAIFAPVQGTISFTRSGKEDLTIDYGDGTCDSLVTLSRGENSKVVDVKSEGRKRFRKIRR